MEEKEEAFLVPYFSMLSWVCGEAVGKVRPTHCPALRPALKERSVWLSLSFRAFWAWSHWGTIPAFVLGCYCTPAVYCTEWQCENRVKIPPGSHVFRQLQGDTKTSVEQWGIFSPIPVAHKQKKCPDKCPEGFELRLICLFCCRWLMHILWVRSRICTLLVFVGAKLPYSPPLPQPQQRMWFIVMMEQWRARLCPRWPHLY